MINKTEQHLDLPSPAPGTTRSLRVLRYGSDNDGPKAYLQAALHANELPGALTLHHLEVLLDQYAVDGKISGQIVLVPVANPIGLTQFIQGTHLGRSELTSGKNFNRHHANLTAAVNADIGASLGTDAATNVKQVRAALHRAIDAISPKDEGEHLRLSLLRLGIDADYCIDLHCASEALMHVYTSPDAWPQLAPLATQMCAQAVMLELRSGGDPFDEALSAPWTELATLHPQAAIPFSCNSCTLELRGHSDVNDELAHVDALNIAKFLMRVGCIDDGPGELPSACCDATPLSGVKYVRSTGAGVIAFMAELGTQIEAGQRVATVVDCYASGNDARTDYFAPSSGKLYARNRGRFAQLGTLLVTIAGDAPDPNRAGTLMLSD
jgi:uncharacterized protein